jgi:PTS system ascorbate-specific IIA component
MPALLIIAHAPLASSFKAVAVHAYPDCSRALLALDVTPAMSPDVVEAQARRMLAQAASPQALILTDVFGATPCNVAQRLADDSHVKVVAGVNVPMLWRTLCYADKSLDAMVARALAGATQGVMQVTSAQPQDRLSQAEG